MILPAAEQDAAEAYSWYEAQESGLGEEFLRCVDAGIEKYGAIQPYIRLFMKAIEEQLFVVFLT